jgi:hypothetical protein
MLVLWKSIMNPVSRKSVQCMLWHIYEITKINVH